MKIALKCSTLHTLIEPWKATPVWTPKVIQGHPRSASWPLGPKQLDNSTSPCQCWVLALDSCTKSIAQDSSITTRDGTSSSIDSAMLQSKLTNRTDSMIHLSFSMRTSHLALRHMCAVVQPKCETRRCSCVGQCQETTSYGCSGHLETQPRAASSVSAMATIIHDQTQIGWDTRTAADVSRASQELLGLAAAAPLSLLTLWTCTDILLAFDTWICMDGCLSVCLSVFLSVCMYVCR